MHLHSWRHDKQGIKKITTVVHEDAMETLAVLGKIWLARIKKILTYTVITKFCRTIRT
ncbi:hypothetical protein DSUL_50301 [Desulfovibrionales bacterium]